MVDKSIIYRKKHTSYEDYEINFYDLLETGMNMDKHIIAGTAFHRPDHQFEPLVSLIPRGSVVYDVGSYIGTFAIPMAIEGMRIFAFEGFPDNYERCKRNTSPYNVKNYQVAVSDKNYEVDSKFNNCMDNEYEVRKIKYARLDDYVKEHSIPDPALVKMDIEGMESIALHGMTHLLENVRPIWAMGYHFEFYSTVEGYPGWVDVKDGGFDFQTFDKLDYAIFDEAFRHVPADILNHRGGEFVFVPKERLPHFQGG